MAAPRPHPPVRLVHPVHATGRGVSACVLGLLDAWHRAGIEVEYWTSAAEPAAQRPYLRLAVPPLRARLHERFRRSDALLVPRVEAAVLDQVREGDLVYVWPRTSLEFVRELVARGARVAVERTNAHRATARAALDRLYALHGLDRARPLTGTHAHGPYEALRETRKLELAHAVVSPSPFVEASLVAAGLDPARVVRSSYAYDPRAFVPAERARPRRRRRARFALVGSDLLRKGLGELLAAWRLADGPGELVVVGDLPEPLARRWSSDLARAEIEVRPWVEDLAGLFAACDAFVLPSHEEGSPIATYQAMAAGLPCLVSPAGGGGVVRDGIDGAVLDPFDLAGWARELVRVAAEPERAAELGANGRERARAFTWERVAARRWTALSGRLAPDLRRRAG